MKVARLSSQGPFMVTAYAKDSPGNAKPEVPLAEFLDGLSNQYDGSVNKLFALFDHFSEEGPRISQALCHEVDKKHGIYEFIKGDIRVLWFYAKGQRGIVICSHGFIKKGQKTPTKDKKHAIKLREEFLKDNGELLFIDD